MAFVTELLPAEEKAKFKFEYSEYNGYGEGKEKWTIDKERNLFFFRTHCRGGGYEGTPEEDSYVLGIDGCTVYIETFPETKNTLNGFNYIWKVKKIIFPSNLTVMKKEIFQYIKEAFISEAKSRIRNKNMGAVEVSFDQCEEVLG